MEAIIVDLARHGIKAIVYETYRSQERQAELFRQHATQLRHVGEHGFGVAADIVFLDHKGEPTWDGDYSILGKLAKAHALVWGGDWGHPERSHSFRDMDHVQWLNEDDQTAVLSGRVYPADEYNPYTNREAVIRG